MLKGTVIVGLLVAAGLFALHLSLQSGSALRYMDSHPEAQWIPAAEYYIGQGYYLMHELPESATFFIRVPQRFPTSDYADDAFFAYIQCLDDSIDTPRGALAEQYQAYIDKYPHGHHLTMIQNRADALRSGTH